MSTIRLEEPLSSHTAWRTGGICDAWAVVHERDALASTLTALRKDHQALTVLGAGTRTIVRDGGLSGAVVRLGNDFALLHFDGATVTVGAAVPVPVLLSACADRGLSGLEGYAHIPGSVGASLSCDDGWAPRVEGCTYHYAGKEKSSTYGQYQRSGKRAIVLEAHLTLEEVGAEEAKKRLLAAWRGEDRVRRPPLSSWFATPKSGNTRDIIERANLADVRLRGVIIPSSSPEMLVNVGGAHARDLQLLHHSALDRVSREVGVDLKSNIRWLGRTYERTP